MLCEILNALYWDLRDRGGLDFIWAAQNRVVYLDYVNGELQVKYPAFLQNTWQLNTALIFVGLWKKEAKIKLKKLFLNEGRGWYRI